MVSQKRLPNPRPLSLLGLSPWAVGLALCIGGSWAQTQGAQAQTDDLADLLSQYGIRPVKPPSPAADFTLPSLSGGNGSLSDHAGDWVVLTFFATWCGPCVTEMPTMERLYQQLGEDGLTVVGVSIDSERRPLEAFVERLDLGFPILWDDAGEAARLYRATSIPLSYLISPQGRIVGVSRGARDWSALSGLLSSIMAAVPTDPDAASGYTATNDSVSLPTQLTPPTANVEVSDSQPRVGKPFSLDVRIRWAGNFDDYIMHPPELDLPEGVVQNGISASTSSEAGSNVVTYQIQLLGEKTGSYDLDPVELLYTPRFESSAVASRVSGPTVELGPRVLAGIDGLTPASLAWGAAVALGVTALLLAGVRYLKGRRGRPVSQGTKPFYEEQRQLLDEARKARLEGEIATFLGALAKMDARLAPEREREPGEEPDTALGRLEGWLEGVRYGGLVPPAEELDQLLRRFERRVEERQPNREQAERASIQLAEDPLKSQP